MSTSNDIYIQKTSQDAAKSRQSAVNRGYIKDDFTKHFIKKKFHQIRKSPIMNRGTYCRFLGIQSVISAFIDTYTSSKKVQVVSLGSGLDTSYFMYKQKLKDRAIRAATGCKVCFFEIDFHAVNESKIKSISESKELLDLLPDMPVIKIDEQSQLVCSDYMILSGDLRSFATDISRKLANPDQPLVFDSSCPTLILSECALIYLHPDDANAIIDFFADNCESQAVYFGYDHIQPFDRFGQQMLLNLSSVGIELKSINAYHSTAKQVERFMSRRSPAMPNDAPASCPDNAGPANNSSSLGAVDYVAAEKRNWSCAYSIDLFKFYSNYVSKDEKTRISKLEILDEVEELAILLGHYCFTFAALNPIPIDSSLQKFIDSSLP
ncbi:Leucine carboxyl methyltransferase 1 [Smittium culicis]|uniref:Leucine carboxyl methyltransferase 1 n=1 Tax=Smittium culicis TaxID=133412 RepID=A0A1R1X2X5_9FUNG|nr:Leucine carboxyl methyltransferase 1 [Smittium culicis]OMJ08996.1 Leucine carboxyl methyltransferase 1 [Smittium culicis]